MKAPLAVLMPVYDDWESAVRVIERLRAALSPAQALTIVVVDDASPRPAPPELSLADIRVIRLRRNLGHQRAICVGLCWIQEHLGGVPVMVMDADGEDAPEDAPRLLAAHAAGGGRVTFAARRRRSASGLFKVLYALYRWMHHALTGIPVRVGNFSVIDAEHVARLTVSAELWSHYAAAVFKSRLPMHSLPIDRGSRVSGASRMNFTALVLHGLSAIAVFAETVVVRLFVALAVFGALLLLLLAVVLGVRFFTPLAIPGWATVAFGILAVLLFQAVGISLVLVMGLLASRQGSNFIPIRDYQVFIADAP